MGGETVRAFVPAPLPPSPPLELSGTRQRLLERALLACGRLDGVTALLPDPELFLYAYVRREAVLSSQIEGTQSSLSDLLLFELDEAPSVPFDDVVEVSNYVAALEHGMARLRGGFPLSNRLLREVHGKLLASGRGVDKQPGEFRRSQNWIGGTRPGNASFVSPRRNASRIAWRRSSAPSIPRTTVYRRSSKPRSPTSSSRPSTRFWTATVGSDGS